MIILRLSKVVEMCGGVYRITHAAVQVRDYQQDIRNICFLYSGDIMTEMMDPFDIVVWDRSCSSATQEQILHRRKLLKKDCYGAYNQCLRFLYDTVACLVLYHIVFIVLKQLVHW